MFTSYNREMASYEKHGDSVSRSFKFGKRLPLDSKVVQLKPKTVNGLRVVAWYDDGSCEVAGRDRNYLMSADRSQCMAIE